MPAEQLTHTFPPQLEHESLRPFLKEVMKSNIDHPYHDFTNENEPLETHIERNGLEVSVGAIGSFTTEEVTRFILATAHTYVDKNTMGDFPQEEDAAWHQLLTVFSEGFSPDDHIVMVAKEISPDQKVIIGGCLVRTGSSDLTVAQAIANPKATHATLQALNFTIPDTHPQLGDMLNGLGSCLEKETYCSSRFFGLNGPDSQRLGVTKKDRFHAIQETIAGVNIARQALEKRLSRSLRYGIADIHDKGFAELVSNLGYWHILTTTNQPTPAVLDKILKHHYKYYTEKDKTIKIVVGPRELTSNAAVKLNESLDQDHAKKLYVQIRQHERQARLATREFQQQLNQQKLEPQLYDMSDPEQRQAYMERAQEISRSLIDSRLTDLGALYKRFHPKDRNFDPQQPHDPSGIHFREWLKTENFIPPFFEQGSRLILPHRASPTGEIQYDVICALPPHLHRQVKEAGANQLFSQELRDQIHHDVDVIAIGTSVGYPIIMTFKELGAKSFTIADYDEQDGIGAPRMGNDDPAKTGTLKIINAREQILRANPHAQVQLYPEGVTHNNINQVLAGLRRDNPDRMLIVIEEIDSKLHKDLIRKTIRQLYPEDPNVLLFSAAELDQSEVAAVIETMQDLPYAGTALDHGAADPYGRGLSPFEQPEVIEATGLQPEQAAALATLTQIMATYGLTTASIENPALSDIGLSPGMVQSLFRLLQGEVSSFEQSPLSTRLTSYFAGVTLISWLEGNLSTNHIHFDGKWLLSQLYDNPEYRKQAQQLALDLQEQLGITPL